MNTKHDQIMFERPGPDGRGYWSPRPVDYIDDMGYRRHEEESAALAGMLWAAWDERAHAAKKEHEASLEVAALESELRTALGTLFDLTRAPGDASARLAYVDGECKELAGRPPKAWSKRLEQAAASVTEARAEADRLGQELRARLERKFWAVEVTDPQRAQVRDHFRRTADAAGLFERLRKGAQEFVARHKTDGHVEGLRAAVDALAAYRHVRAGEACPDCSAQLLWRTRAFDGGKFIGCSRFPDCAYAWGVELGHTHNRDRVPAHPAPAKPASEPAPELRTLAAALSRHFDAPDAVDMCREAGLDPRRPMPIEPSSTGQEAWTVLLREAAAQGRVEALRLRVQAGLELCGPAAQARVDALWAAWARGAACTTTAPVGTTAEEEVKKDMADNKSAPGIGAAMGMLFEMTKDDTGDAVWRTAADETVETLKAPARIALKKAQRTAMGKPVAAFALKAIDHPLGEGVFSWAAGLAIVTYGPLRGKTLGPKTLRLSKELRVKGIKPFTDLFAKTIIAPVRDTIVRLVESLPDEGIIAGS